MSVVATNLARARAPASLPGGRLPAGPVSSPSTLCRPCGGHISAAACHLPCSLCSLVGIPHRPNHPSASTQCTNIHQLGPCAAAGVAPAEPPPLEPPKANKEALRCRREK